MLCSQPTGLEKIGKKMEELLKEMSVNTNNICIKLEEIANVLSQTDWLGIIGPWILSIISGIVGYKISSRNEKRAFKRNCHIEYLSFTNDFLNEVNSIIMELVNLQKMGFILMGFDKKPEGSEKYFYGNLNDYNSVVYKIRELRKEIDKIQVDERNYSSIREYKEKYVTQSDDVLNFNKFIEICSTYQKKAANYYYLISKDLRKEHAEIINKIAKATQNNMIGFNVEELKKELVDHINNINAKIVGKKIKEPNWFNAEEQKA